MPRPPRPAAGPLLPAAVLGAALAALPAGHALDVPLAGLHGGALDLGFAAEVDTCVPLHCSFWLAPTLAADGGAHAGPARLLGDASCGAAFDVAFASDGVPGTLDLRATLPACEAESFDRFWIAGALLAGPAPEAVEVVAGRCGISSCGADL